MLRVLKHARIPLFFHKKSNHVFMVWQHVVVLLTVRDSIRERAIVCLLQNDRLAERKPLSFREGLARLKCRRAVISQVV